MGGGGHWEDPQDRLVARVGDGSLLGPSRPPVPLPLGCSASISRVMQTFPITSSRLENKSQEQDMAWDRCLPTPPGRRQDGPHHAFWGGGWNKGVSCAGATMVHLSPQSMSATLCCQLEKQPWANNFTHLCPKAQASTARCGFSGVYNGVEHAGSQSHHPPSPHAERPLPHSQRAHT